MPIHTARLSIDNQFPVMMSVIKPLSIFSFKVLMRDGKVYVRSVTLRCICCEWYVTFQPERFTEESPTLVNAFIKGLVVSHVGLEWLLFKPKTLCFEVKVMFPYWCHHAPEYDDTVW